VGIYNFVLTANFSCLSLSTTSDNNRVQELEAQIAALQLAQGISQFIVLIYVLYCYLCAVTFLINLLLIGASSTAATSSISTSTSGTYSDYS